MKAINQVKKYGSAFARGAVVAAPLAIASGAARAEIDVTPITTLLGEAATAVGLVGVALLLVWGTKKAYAAVRGG
ncbi:phage coat protein [Methylobacillus flagellatus]|uniref:major capsid protein n=1 Tax=Methylobacillus flagellatus TaxID=405 RepID=UPI002853CEDC|nr:major capsid protein [Methylobacillus flagellatus]MDR5172280.1 phage coat protein [Methylobacillus flagellatus]